MVPFTINEFPILYGVINVLNKSFFIIVLTRKLQHMFKRTLLYCQLNFFSYRFTKAVFTATILIKFCRHNSRQAKAPARFSFLHHNTTKYCATG